MSIFRNEELFTIFSNYANFGAGNKASQDIGEIDNARFAKLCKETKVIDTTVTTTDVDIMFNKYKNKGARKLHYDGFKKALQELADKKYKGKLAESDPDSYTCLVNHICKKGASGPSVNATVADTKGTVYDKLTDTKKYTGTHKNRFDENGKGKGIAGRVDVPEKRKNDFGSRPGLNASTASLAHKSSVGASVGASIDKLHAKVPANEKDSKRLGTEKKAVSKSQGSVFDRLTDASNYTGTHQHRFNTDGTGKGLEGRDSTQKGAGTGHAKHKGGDVKNLSQILRQ